DGIRAFHVTGVQTCALPISGSRKQDVKSAPAIAGYFPRRRFPLIISVEVAQTNQGEGERWNCVSCTTKRRSARWRTPSSLSIPQARKSVVEGQGVGLDRARV